MRHRLPDGRIETRTTRKPYTHVVCGVWSRARIEELRDRARSNIEKFSEPSNDRERKKLRRSLEELETYGAMKPGGHYVVSWELSRKDAEQKMRKSQRHVRDRLYVSEIVPP